MGCVERAQYKYSSRPCSQKHAARGRPEGRRRGGLQTRCVDKSHQPRSVTAPLQAPSHPSVRVREFNPTGGREVNRTVEAALRLNPPSANKSRAKTTP